MSLREQLNAIYETQGTLTPKLVVQQSAPKDHPLHDRFEWDNKIAGPKYREVQAAELIRSVKIVFRDSAEAEPVSIRAFHNVPSPDRNGYMPLDAVMDDEFSRTLVLRNAEREWKDLKRKYGHLSDFMALVITDLTAISA